MNARAEIAGILCRSLDEARLPWSITHGAEGFPHKVGRDFDILLPIRFHARAVSLIKGVAKKYGWSSCLLPLSWAGSPVFLWKLDKGQLYSFEMHFIDRVDWAGCILADSSSQKTNCTRIEGLSIATWPSFAKRILIQILAGCWHRVSERPDEMSVSNSEGITLESNLTRIFGKKLGTRLMHLIEVRDFEGIKLIAPYCRWMLIIRAIIPYIGTSVSMKWFVGKIQRIIGHASWRPPCLFIVGELDRAETIESILSHITPQLGFGSCRIFHSSNSIGIIDRLLQRWDIHIRRSKFQLVAIHIDQHEHSYSQLTKKYGKNSVNTGFYIICHNGESSKSFDRHTFESSKIINIRPEVGTDKYTRVAHEYMNHFEALSQQ